MSWLFWRMLDQSGISRFCIFLLHDYAVPTMIPPCSCLHVFLATSMNYIDLHVNAQHSKFVPPNVEVSFSLLTQASKTSQTEALVSHCQLYFVPALGNPPRQWDSTQLKRQLWISLQQPHLERPAKVIRLCIVCFHELPQTMTPHLLYLFAGHQRPKMYENVISPNLSECWASGSNTGSIMSSKCHQPPENTQSICLCRSIPIIIYIYR